MIMKNDEVIRKNLQIMSKTKSFTSKYNQKGINYLSRKDNRKTFQKNNPKITLNVLYVKEMNKYPTYISKHNLNHEN